MRISTTRIRSRWVTAPRHCEERSDEAIQSLAPHRLWMDCFAEPVIARAFARPVARNDVEDSLLRMMLHHHAQPFRRARDAGVEPSRAAVLERKALVEQHHVVPLRALLFEHR